MAKIKNIVAIPPNAGEDVKKLDLHPLPVGMSCGIATLENSVMVSLKDKTCNYYTTQQQCSWAFIPEKSNLTFTQKPARECIKQLYFM